MKKHICFKILVFIMLFYTLDVFALTSTSSELTNRSVCESFELALANSDDSITSVACYDDYNSAKAAMDEHEDDNAIILEKVSGNFKVIDAKYAIAYLGIKAVTQTTNIYTTSSLSTTITYMNNHSNFGATDGAFIELNYSNKAIKVKVNGVTGWIRNNEYRLIPLSWVKTTNYYYINSSDIRHYYAKDIEQSNYTQLSYAIGPSPSGFEVNKRYYSYDGIYLYHDLKTMLGDYKQNNYDNSVNKDNPYYNYYLYLPHRSRTTYTVDDIEVFLRSVLGFRGSIYGRQTASNYSVLFGQADFFLNSEKLYGANAISVLSLSRNESANGRSSIAITKNNIFGHNAVDGSAYSSATGYLDVRSSIYTHGYGFINYGYSEIADWRYRGGHFGNKNSGMNVQYASDPYWGEKAASYYYGFDKDNGLSDYNYYQLAVSNNTNINARTKPNTSSSVPFVYKYQNIPVIILEEVEGQVVNGSNIWYLVQADSNLNSTLTGLVSASSSWPQYNWESAVYVHSSYFTKINDAKNSDGTYNKPIDVNNEPIYNYTYKSYADSSSFTPIVGLATENIDYYYTSSLTNKRGTLLQDSYVTILEEAKTDDDIRYLVIVDYSTNQKAWISGEKITLVQKDLLGYLSKNSTKIDIYDKVNGTDIGDIYTDNYLTIVDKIEDNGDIWAKVQFKINPITYGYIKVASNMSYTFNYLNELPVIVANDKTILINSTYDLLDGVTGTDEEDGDITDKIEISENNIKIDTAGTYTVTYSLTDSYGETVTKRVNITVTNYENRDPLFMYNSLIHKDANIFNISGFLGVKGLDNKEVVHTLSFINQLTNKEYDYLLTNWQDYPYEMSSLDDDKSYDYSGGWFNSDVDLTSLPSGDYTVYVKAVNGKYTTISLFTNIAYMEMTRRVENNGRGYRIEIDFTTSGSPLVFSVRDNGLLSYDEPLTIDPMYNYFTEIKVSDNSFNIRGTSHNYGVDLNKDKEVKRELILENTTDFTRYTFDLGSIVDGDYQVSLAVSDNCDKTKAWFDKSIDLTNVNDGTYALYIKNTVDGKSYYSELIDIAYTDFTKINNSRYTFKRVDDKRLRVELTINK